MVSLGGSYRQVASEDVANALLEVARAENATQIVLGTSHRARLATLLLGEPIAVRLARRAGPIDIRQVSRDSNGTAPATVSAGETGPHRTGSRQRAVGAHAEQVALIRLATSVLCGHGDLPELLEEIREMFGLTTVSLLERQQNGTPEPRWFIIASTGDPAPERPGADVEMPVSETVMLAGRGRAFGEADKQVLFACAAPLVASLAAHRDPHRGDTHAEAAGPRSGRGLRAVAGQQARSLLAAADEVLTQLGDPGLTVTADERAALRETGHRSLGQLARLMADIGELSRLHAGALETYLRPVDLDEVVTAALDDLGPGGRHIAVRMAENLPDVITDAALLSRILASLTAEALHSSPPASTPVLATEITAGKVEIRIVDYQASVDENGGADSVALRLSRDLAEAIGHTLRCEQTPGGGRTVVIGVPAAVARSRAGAPVSASSVGLGEWVWVGRQGVEP